jgi:glycosyltransferase involved in cell wall biosynthesis
MKKPSKIFCLWDYNSWTGFATVSKNIKREIKKHFGEDVKIDICAINYFGEPYEEEDGTYVISAIKSAPKKDDFGRLGFMKILQDSNDYDGIFILQDLGVICPIINILKTIKDEKKNQNKKSFKSIFYFPVDCQLIDKLVENLDFFDCLVTYTNYGRDEVLRLRPELKGKLKVVPHGNNSKDFYPIEDEKEVMAFRKEYFGKNADKFIILNVNRNQPRKDIPTTIFAFIEAKKRWKEENLPHQPFLYLHMNAKDPMGWDIRGVMLQTDLVEGEDYKLLDTEIANKGASVEMLNKIYNASDVYVTTTLGEGWGLTLTEAMATKTPVVCPNSTSFIEMTDNGKRAYTLDNLIPYCNTIDNVIRLQCDHIEVADTIVHIAKTLADTNDEIGFREHYNKRIEEAYKWCKSLDWKDVCKSWVQYFKETY